ncbi:MAG TPA: response regulator [Thermodesulfobacteriota bacterium]
MDFKKHPGDTAMFSPSGKVLVVDDDDGIRHLCREVLESAGYRVETAKNGLEGLTKVRRNEYDLVVSDVNMPELDGMEFFDGAASSCPGLAERFLFMSGSISEELEEAVTARGALFLPKPFRITELIGAVERLMSKPLEGVLGAPEGRRSEGRIGIALQCAVEARSGAVRAELLDLSPRGVKAVYRGSPLKEGESVWVRLDSGLAIERKARVVWSRKDGEKALSGLRFEAPMPASSIINMHASNHACEDKAC